MNAPATYDLAVRGGTLVDEYGETHADIYVRDSKVVAVADPAVALAARAEFDATGLHVLPGVIDAHVHFRTLSKHSDNFYEMTRSAAHGGVTTVLAHIMGMNTTQLRPLARAMTFLDEASHGSATDFGFHLAIADEPGTLEDIPEVVALGVRSFKMFMAYRARGMQIGDGSMLAAMQTIEEAGGRVMIHAEAGDLADQLEAEYRGRQDVLALSDSRPPWIEAEATRRALVIAGQAGTTAYFVHVSSKEALYEIMRARSEGQRVIAETCPQYLNLTVDDFARLGGLAKIAPPLRSREHAAALLAGVVAGEVQVVGSDHSPYTKAAKQLGDLWDVPMGAPGTETLVASTWRALQSYGGSVQQLVRVLCAEPARAFGLYPRKGTIAVGSDADFTIVDMAGETTIDGEKQHNTSGYSVYDGLTSPLRVHSSFLRGAQLLSDGGLVADHLGELPSRVPTRSFEELPV